MNTFSTRVHDALLAAARSVPDGTQLSVLGRNYWVTSIRAMVPDMAEGPSFGGERTPVLVTDQNRVLANVVDLLPSQDVPLGYIMRVGAAPAGSPHTLKPAEDGDVAFATLRLEQIEQAAAEWVREHGSREQRAHAADMLSL